MEQTRGYKVRREVTPVEMVRFMAQARWPSLKQEPNSKYGLDQYLGKFRRTVNACVVKPVAFDQFIEAVKQLGLFWMLINKIPPGTTGF